MGAVALDQDRERELGASVQRAKAALLELLTPEEQKSKKATIENARHCAYTFEDAAGAIAIDETDPRRAQVASALRQYQIAINSFWIYVHSSGAIEKLYSLWKGKHKVLAKMVAREDVEAEILFQVRDIIRRWDPEAGTRFMTYAPRVLFEDLAEWIRLQTTVIRRPRSDRRKNTEQDVAITSASREFSHFAEDPEDGVHRQKRGDLSYTPDEDALLELIDQDAGRSDAPPSD